MMHGDVVIFVKLNQTKFIDAGTYQEGLLLLQARPLLPLPGSLCHASGDEVYQEEAGSGGGDDKDSIITDHQGTGLTLHHDTEAGHVLGPGGWQGPP